MRDTHSDNVARAVMKVAKLSGDLGIRTLDLQAIPDDPGVQKEARLLARIPSDDPGGVEALGDLHQATVQRAAVQEVGLLLWCLEGGVE